MTDQWKRKISQFLFSEITACLICLKSKLKKAIPKFRFGLVRSGWFGNPKISNPQP